MKNLEDKYYEEYKHVLLILDMINSNFSHSFILKNRYYKSEYYLRAYYKYVSEGKTNIISREELTYQLKGYLRRMKLEKICLNIK